MLSSTIVAQKGRKVVGVDDLDEFSWCGFWGVGVESIWHIWSHNQKNHGWSDLGYAYFYCELLNQVGLTMITLWVKSPHIQMHKTVLQKGLYVKVENFGFEVRYQNGFEKGDMPIILMVESTIIVSSITTFEPTLIPMFFHSNFLKEFKSRSLQSKFPTATIVIIVYYNKRWREQAWKTNDCQWWRWIESRCSCSWQSIQDKIRPIGWSQKLWSMCYGVGEKCDNNNN